MAWTRLEAALLGDWLACQWVRSFRGPDNARISGRLFGEPVLGAKRMQLIDEFVDVAEYLLVKRNGNWYLTVGLPLSGGPLSRSRAVRSLLGGTNSCLGNSLAPMKRHCERSMSRRSSSNSMTNGLLDVGSGQLLGSSIRCGRQHSFTASGRWDGSSGTAGTRTTVLKLGYSWRSWFGGLSSCDRLCSHRPQAMRRWFTPPSRGEVGRSPVSLAISSQHGSSLMLLDPATMSASTTGRSSLNPTG